MFRLSYSTPFKGEMKTLKLTRNPLMHGLGHYRDTDGKLWDIHGVIGGEKPYVQARPVDHHPNYYGTHSGASENGHHTWNPYYFEVEEAP